MRPHLEHKERQREHGRDGQHDGKSSGFAVAAPLPILCRRRGTGRCADGVAAFGHRLSETLTRDRACGDGDGRHLRGEVDAGRKHARNARERPFDPGYT